MNSLNGKVALVTGGSRGIGTAIVRRLVQEGAAVAFTFASSQNRAEDLVAEITMQGGIAIAIRADNAVEGDVKEAIARTVAKFERIDILVNNAGIVVPGTIDDYPLAEFDRVFAVNVRAAFVAIQEALRHMGEGGRILNISSVVARYSGVPGIAVYAMSKGALSAMTRSLARDLGARGITVNAIEPGPTETDNIRNDDVRSMLRARMALGRLGEDHEIASLVAYLASDEAAFITGSLMTIDGGYLA